MRTRSLWIAALLAIAFATGVGSATADDGSHGNTTTVVYDSFQKPGGYTLADYLQKWSNIYGLGEMAYADTRNFAGGSFNVSAAPFHTGFDFSVFDHLKYMGVSTESFPVPSHGDLTFRSTITAQTPGTIPGLVIHGTYTATGAPYSATLLQGQQAGVVMNMIDFCTGQLFDWFVAGDTAFTLIERLPTSVTGNTTNPACPGASYVGASKMYTQIVREVPVRPNVPHVVAITYSGKKNAVDYYLDGRRISHVDRVGIPLDRQGADFTGTYPSLGPGEDLQGQIHAFAIGHGLFSLLDAFPFQHPEAPEGFVSIPVGDSTPASAGHGRLFGQGAIARFDDFTVVTKRADD
jgi:hypothetical protein